MGFIAVSSAFESCRIDPSLSFQTVEGNEDPGNESVSAWAEKGTSVCALNCVFISQCSPMDKFALTRKNCSCRRGILDKFSLSRKIWRASFSLTRKNCQVRNLLV